MVLMLYEFKYREILFVFLNIEESNCYELHFIVRLSMQQRSTTNWRFEVLMTTLQNNTIRCIHNYYFWSINVTRPFDRRKQVHSCYIAALMFACFLLQRAVLRFWPKTVVTSFLHLIMLFCVISDSVMSMTT